MIVLLSGVGIIRLGIVPDAETTRCGCSRWFLVTVIYVAFWLALATPGSVVFRRAATAALVVIAVWLVLTFFGNQIVSVVADYLRPLPASATATETLANARMAAEPGRLSPITLFTETTQALLDPRVQSLDPFFSDPTGRAFPTALPFGQSLLLIWPQVVLLLAGTAICFAARLHLVHAPGDPRLAPCRGGRACPADAAGAPGAKGIRAGRRRGAGTFARARRPGCSSPGRSSGAACDPSAGSSQRQSSVQARLAARRRPWSPPRNAVCVSTCDPGSRR